MKALQTVAMGLVLVFLDVAAHGWDVVPDPLGWVLVLAGLTPVRELLPGYRGVLGTAWVCLVVAVLTWPPGSVDTAAESLGWLFSLPTVAFAFLLSAGLRQVLAGSLATRFRALRDLLVVVAVLPVLVYGAGFGWLAVPTAVLAVAVNIALVVWLWEAGHEDGAEDTVPARPAPRAR